MPIQAIAQTSHDRREAAQIERFRKEIETRSQTPKSETPLASERDKKSEVESPGGKASFCSPIYDGEYFKLWEQLNADGEKPDTQPRFTDTGYSRYKALLNNY